MDYRLLQTPGDGDIPGILAAYRHPSIARFITIDEENYWPYVTETGNVWFYKIFDKNALCATAHLELHGSTLHMDIAVFPEYQNRGVGTEILNHIQTGKLGIPFDQIRVSVDENNTASISLFEKAGFIRIGQAEELLEYVYSRN